MTTAAIKEQLHHFVDNLDANKAKAIYTLFAAEIDMDAQRRALIFQERESYLNGNGQSFSVADVKAMAKDKTKRSGLQH